MLLGECQAEGQFIVDAVASHPYPHRGHEQQQQHHGYKDSIGVASRPTGKCNPPRLQNLQSLPSLMAHKQQRISRPACHHAEEPCAGSIHSPVPVRRVFGRPPRRHPPAGHRQNASIGLRIASQRWPSFSIWATSTNRGDPAAEVARFASQTTGDLCREGSRVESSSGRQS